MQRDTKDSGFSIATGAAFAASLLIACFNLFVLVPKFRVYPTSDEWQDLAPLAMNTTGEFIQWLFAQHVDHRIPIQNAIHYGALAISGYDFRVPVAVNIVVATGLSLIMIATARRYRGHSSIGDLLIPLCILSFGAGYANFSFDGQFLSSTFFLGCFVYFSTRHDRRTAMFLSIVACALCGLNGLILATTCACGTMLFSIWNLARCNIKTRRFDAIAALSCIILCAVVWVAWQPSPASNIHTFNAPRLAAFFFGLLNSSLVVSAYSNIVPKSIILIGSTTFALSILILALVRAARKKASVRYSTLAIFLSIVGTLILLLSTAIGRSRLQAWSPGMDMHYGMLAAPLPVIAWIVISEDTPNLVSTIIGTLLVGLFGLAAIQNFEWKYNFVMQNGNHVEEVRRRLAGPATVASILNQNILDLYYTDGVLPEQTVAQGLPLLRAHAGWIKQESNPQ